MVRFVIRNLKFENIEITDEIVDEMFLMADTNGEGQVTLNVCVFGFTDSNTRDLFFVVGIYRTYHSSNQPIHNR